ncbi:MAG: hypothetical protein C5B60_07090 [Chloroflexi bacterium]|nr:MAG: hypothetical protein C5B60_07090 [Chloroflexota bacterium]
MSDDQNNRGENRFIWAFLIIVMVLIAIAVYGCMTDRWEAADGRAQVAGVMALRFGWSRLRYCDDPDRVDAEYGAGARVVSAAMLRWSGLSSDIV